MAYVSIIDCCWHHAFEFALCRALQGVFSAATGAGIIIGAYFAFYSTTKRALREHTQLSDGACRRTL
jgi:hypothetical protein